MAVVLLARHGQASFGSENYDELSDLGREQSRLLGTVIAQRGIQLDRVVSGALRRQRETAEICLEATGAAASLAEDARWDEYNHEAVLRWGFDSEAGAEFAAAQTETAADLNRTVQAVLDRALEVWVDAGDRDATESSSAPVNTSSEVDPADDSVSTEPAPGESHPAFVARVNAAFTAAASQPGTTLVVSSAGAIAAVCAELIGLPVRQWPALQRVMVNTSLTKVVNGRLGTSMISFNDHGHLEGTSQHLITYR